MIFTVVASKKGSIPRFKSLGIVEMVLFACNVERTRCPVNAALEVILAVSSSLISPTIMIFGSCLNMERSPFANVNSAFELICI